MELEQALKVVRRTLSINGPSHPPGSANHYLKLSERQHAMHALHHLEAFFANVDDGEDHLGHAAARLLLSLEVREL